MASYRSVAAETDVLEPTVLAPARENRGRLEAIRAFGGITVTDCRGFGRAKLSADRTTRNRPPSSVVVFTDMVKLEIVVAVRSNAEVEADSVSRTARTGSRGDGKIITWPVSRTTRLRTSEEGATAI